MMITGMLFVAIYRIYMDRGFKEYEEK